MGLYDHVKCTGPAFVCSEGHDLSGQEFQTKDLGCTMGYSTIGERLAFDNGGYGDPDGASPFTGKIDVYCSCPRCPVFVQARTGSIIDVWCQFDVDIAADVVLSVRMTSTSTAEWLATEPTREYMADCEGPLALADAKVRREEIWRERRLPAVTPPG